MPESKAAILKRTYTEWSSHNALRLAAAMALYVMMALAPLLVVALTVFSFMAGGKAGAQAKIQDRAAMLVGADGGKAISQMLTVSSAHGKGGVIAAIIGFVIALVSATGLFISLQDAINTIWDVKPKPDAGWKAMVRARVVSLVVMAAACIILLASFVASAALSIIIKHLPGWLSWASFMGDIIVSLGVVTAIFAMVYKFLPDVKLNWKDVWLGAAITAALFVAGKYGLTLYFKYASVASPYGAAGSLAALLIWIYYSAAIAFFGAEFTRVYAESSGTPIEPDEYAVKLSTVDRAKRGEPHPDELQEAQAAAGKGPRQTGPRRAPLRWAAGMEHDAPAAAGPHSSKAVRLVVAGAGLAVGALAGALGARAMTSEENRMRARLEELGARDRLAEAERRMRRATHLHNLLEKMNVKERLDAVEDRIQTIARQTQRQRRPRAPGRPATRR
ncbi:MAG TPA: YihY/virulence factor BrkB family protein [Tepidisphaeraceae bacterium]|nr:YihY/virulence factor BrkB family protein [Tepidisphaeraceae bacterium]